MMKFLQWFKGSLEDDAHTASFRRIYNWILTCLIVFFVVYATINNLWSMHYIYVLLILLLAVFLNIGTVTVDNILRFFNRDQNNAPEPDPQPQKANITGGIIITPAKP